MASAAVASQSMLEPHSPQAAAIAGLWWVMFGVFGIALLLVLLLLALALWRGRQPDPRPLAHRQSRRLVLIAGVAVPAMVLLVLVVGSVRTGAGVMSAAPAGALSIEVTGRQWWWEVRYLDDDDQPIAVTANEIHVPVGRPVRLLLRTDDVIHSLWVPNLQGKLDMIPGKTTSSWFETDRAGVYRGQCAELCGVQHALMAFEVVAVEPAAFERWLTRQAQPAAPPADPRATAGLAVFVEAGCGDCHRIRGTAADGSLGPDLTHLAGRRTLAAATMPNTIGHLGGWISDPQARKPGALMPATRLAADDHAALIAYLQSLY